MIDFFFRTAEAFEKAVGLLAKSDIMAWAMDASRLVIGVCSHDDKEFLIQKLELNGVLYGTYRIVEPRHK